MLCVCLVCWSDRASQSTKAAEGRLLAIFGDAETTKEQVLSSLAISPQPRQADSPEGGKDAKVAPAHPFESLETTREASGAHSAPLSSSSTTIATPSAPAKTVQSSDVNATTHSEKAGLPALSVVCSYSLCHPSSEEGLQLKLCEAHRRDSGAVVHSRSTGFPDLPTAGPDLISASTAATSTSSSLTLL